MTPLITQLESLLRDMLGQQQTLLKAVDDHMAALRTYRIESIEAAVRNQETARQQLLRIEQRRKVLLAQFLRMHRNLSKPTLDKLAEIYPDRKLILLQMRSEIVRLTTEIRTKLNQLQRIAAGVLLHLNSTVKLIATAAAGPSTYSRAGAYAMPARVSSLQAVG
jgi:hypothetical protein